MKKTQLLATLDSPTTSRGPWRDEEAGQTTKKPPGPKPVCLLSEGEHWKGECPERPPVGPRGANPTGPSSLRISQMRDSRTLTDGLSACPAPDPTPSILISPVEPRVTLHVAGRRTEFLVDTGAACSVLTWPAGPFSNHDCTVTGVDGQLKVRQFTSPFACGIGSVIITPFCTCQNALSLPQERFAK